jgi:Xaa-Pro aminopeptidase
MGTVMPRRTSLIGFAGPFVIVAWTPLLVVGAGLLPQAALAAQAPPAELQVPAEVLVRRRAAVLEYMEPGIAFVPSADPKEEWQHPQDSDFRQDNTFYYLTGLETPGSWLVLFKELGGAGRAVLYVPGRDRAAEMWTGPRPGPGPELARATGIEAVNPADEFEGKVLSRLRRSGAYGTYPRVYLPLGGPMERLRGIVDLALQTGRTIVGLGDALARLRLVKDSVELARLRRAVEITGEAQRAAMRAARPGMYEYELEAVVEYVFRSRGAERVGFPTIVGSGPNSVVLHYDENRRRMEESDLVVIDAGAEYGYYTADITRTFPVGGTFTPRQRAIYELVLGAQQAAIDSVRPGMTIWRLDAIARSYMRDHSGDLCGGVGCDAYFRHGLSHWLGMDVHDVGDYGTPLAPGMVLTVEPGIYLADESLGVRIEDVVLVTEAGHEVLSAGIPRTVPEIEALMAEGPEECGCRP